MNGHATSSQSPEPAASMEVAALRVVVVDDDYLVREGARSVLSSVPGVEVVGLAANPTELDERILETFPQVVVLDIRMPPTYRMEGIEAAHEVLALMASGRNNAAIARDLVLSERAVEKHINSIFRKLGLSEQMEVNQRVAAVLFFLQRNE